MEQQIIQIVADGMIAAAKVSGPVLIVTLGVGLLLSIVQSATQIQESTLTFLPKVVAAGIVLVVTGSWALGVLVSFTHQVFDQLPRLLGG